MEKRISKILKYGTLISTYLLIGSVLLQIFSRFLLQNTPAWTEEASRLFFIYATSFAAGLALKTKYYVHLDLFFNSFAPKAQQRGMLVIHASTLILFIIITIFAIKFVILGHYEFSPSMKIRMSFVFMSMVILGGSISYYAARDFIRSYKNLSK